MSKRKFPITNRPRPTRVKQFVWREKGPKAGIVALVLLVALMVIANIFGSNGVTPQQVAPPPPAPKSQIDPNDNGAGRDASNSSNPNEAKTSNVEQVNNPTDGLFIVDLSSNEHYAVDSKGLEPVKNLTAEQVRKEHANGPNGPIEEEVRKTFIHDIGVNPNALMLHYNATPGMSTKIKSVNDLVEGGKVVNGAKYSAEGKARYNELKPKLEKALITITPSVKYDSVNTGVGPNGPTYSEGVSGNKTGVDVEYPDGKGGLIGYSVLARCKNVTTLAPPTHVKPGPTDERPPAGPPSKPTCEQASNCQHIPTCSDHPNMPQCQHQPNCTDNPNLPECQHNDCTTHPNAPECNHIPTCEENPDQSQCQPPSCEDNPNQDECNPPTCEENPSSPDCNPPNCEDNPQGPDCEQDCTDNPDQDKCQPTECNPNDYPQPTNPPVGHEYVRAEDGCHWVLQKKPGDWDCEQNWHEGCPGGPVNQPPQDNPGQDTGPTPGAPSDPPSNTTPTPVDNGSTNTPAPDPTDNGSNSGSDPSDPTDHSGTPSGSTTDPGGSTTTDPGPTTPPDDTHQGGDNSGMPPVPMLAKATTSTTTSVDHSSASTAKSATSTKAASETKSVSSSVTKTTPHIAKVQKQSVSSAHNTTKTTTSTQSSDTGSHHDNPTASSANDTNNNAVATSSATSGD